MAQSGGYVPPPTPRPAYDPNEEPPKWSWYRMRFNLPVEKGPIPWTKIGDNPKSDDDPDWRGVVRSKVEKWPAPVEYKFGAPDSDKYFWFDTPDYADPFKKLGYAFKFFAVSSVTMVGLTGFYRGTVMTWPNCFQLFKEIGTLWVGAGMAASATAITAANLRGDVDDIKNYVIAGFVFGTILGHQNFLHFIRRVGVSVPAAVYVKFNAETNGSIIPVFNARAVNLPISGLPAEGNWRHGDWRFGIHSSHGEPGRDVRIPYA